MANIATEIKNFLTAIYGKDVRASMVSLAEKLNREVENNTTDAKNAADRANTSASNADAATTKANAATERANTAASNAEKATSEAQVATQNANTATENANTAARNANVAADRVDTAINAANAAADRVDTAINTANTAAENANQQALNAQNAAGDARAIIEETQIAKQAAMTATDEAHTAADSANAAAENANQAAANANSMPDRVAALEKETTQLKGDLTKKADASAIPTKTSQLTNDSNFATKSDIANVGSDSVEILLPSEVVAVVGIEFNIYYKSIIRSNRPLDNFEIKCSLNDTSVPYKLLSECFRLTATESNIGDYTFTVQIKDTISGSVKATKTTTLHIIKNRTLNTKNVLYIGDSLTASRGGLYSAEIQYNLSSGKLISIGSQDGSAETNTIGEVKHEGYNGAPVGGFLSADITSGNVNPFYNPTTSEFDLSYFMTNRGYSQIDAVCLNLGHNNIGNHVNAVSGLQTIISKIHEYKADIPVIVSLITPLANQDGWSVKTKSTAEEMRRHWKNLISAYITAFDNGVLSNVYLSTPYLNVDQDNDFPTETVARNSRDTTQIVRQNDAMHPSRIGTLKMADVYYANLLYRIPEDDAIYYTVTNNLTNVTTSNNVGSVKEGSAYSATLTPSDGYVLDSVSVTMNGNPVSVTNGVINISGVTGDIVITATAKVYVPNYTNLAKPSTANNSAPNTALTADEWLNGYYISSKTISAKAGLIVINKIPLTKDQTLRITGIATTGNINNQTCSSRFRILPCDASGNALVTEIQPTSTTYVDQMNQTELANGVYCFKPSELEQASYWANVAFVRICGYPIDGNNANVIVTVNEPIE